MKNKQKSVIFIIFILVILVIIFSILYLRPKDDVSLKEIQCIASKSKLFVKKGCGHCAAQKNYLGEYLSYFEVIDCAEERDECIANQIEYVPTWIIGGEKYVTPKTFSELKELTGC